MPDSRLFSLVLVFADSIRTGRHSLFLRVNMASALVGAMHAVGPADCFRSASVLHQLRRQRLPQGATRVIRERRSLKKSPRIVMNKAFRLPLLKGPLEAAQL